MDYIRIVDWDKFQHYKKRSPPWIKLHVSLLDNQDFECLHNDSKVLLICLWLFAARKGNGEIPYNQEYLQRKLPAGKRVKLQPLIDAGFIECYQNDSKVRPTETKYLCAETETETETEAETEERERHKDFVLLTPTEYKKLIEKLGDTKTQEWIEELNGAIGARGYKCKSHYLTILNWDRRAAKEHSPKKTKLFPISGKICSVRGCRLPAVYKDSSGDYDNHKCSDHLPEKVKERYE